MQFILVYVEEGLGPLLHLRRSIVRQQTPVQNNINNNESNNNILVDKYLRANTVQMLHKYFFFKVKPCIIFLFVVAFFKRF